MTERGGRIKAAEVTERFAEYRDERRAGVGADSPHALRHSYVTHLIEDGFDELFVRMQVGHRYASTTALYTGVSAATTRTRRWRARCALSSARLVWSVR